MLRRSPLSLARPTTDIGTERTTTSEERMPRDDAPNDERRWRPRPLLAGALRFVSVLVPTAAGAATAFLYVFHVPMPAGIGLVAWSVGLAVASTVATAL